MLMLTVAIALSIRPCRHRTVPIAPSALPFLGLSIPRCRCGDAAITPPPPSSRPPHPHCGSPTLSAVIVLHTAPVMILTTAHSIECVIFGMFFFSRLYWLTCIFYRYSLTLASTSGQLAPLSRPALMLFASSGFSTGKCPPSPSVVVSTNNIHCHPRVPTLTFTLARPLSPSPSRARSHPRHRAPTLTLTGLTLASSLGSTHVQPPRMRPTHHAGQHVCSMLSFSFFSIFSCINPCRT
jgi:hypothetical protein